MKIIKSQKNMEDVSKNVLIKHINDLHMKIRDMAKEHEIVARDLRMYLSGMEEIHSKSSATIINKALKGGLK